MKYNTDNSAFQRSKQRRIVHTKKRLDQDLVSNGTRSRSPPTDHYSFVKYVHSVSVNPYDSILIADSLIASIQLSAYKS
jgi:hypothetical protein